MGFMLWVLRISIALRLIAVAVTAHVMSVNCKATINIGVNGIYVMSVKNFNSSEVNCCSGYCSCHECREFQ